MSKFRTWRTLGLLAQTTPFIFLRLAVYIGVAVVYTVVVGVGGSIGLMFGKAMGNSGMWFGLGGIVGFAIASGVLYFAREYVLYLVKAAHVAVLVRLMDGKPIPCNKGQIRYGRDVVREHFASSSALFGLNQLIRGALRAFNAVTLDVASWLPVPGLESMTKLVDKIIGNALGHLDQVILAQIIRAETRDPSATAADSVVLYAQNYKGAFKNAAFLTLILWCLTLLIFLLVVVPVTAIFGMLDVHRGLWAFGFSVIAAWCLKAAIVDPFATAALIQIYDGLTAGQAPNTEWAARLESISSKFRELVHGAGNSPAPSSK